MNAPRFNVRDRVVELPDSRMLNELCVLTFTRQAQYHEGNVEAAYDDCLLSNPPMVPITVSGKLMDFRVHWLATHELDQSLIILEADSPGWPRDHYFVGMTGVLAPVMSYHQYERLWWTPSNRVLFIRSGNEGGAAKLQAFYDLPLSRKLSLLGL